MTVTHIPSGELRWPLAVVRAFKSWSIVEGRYIFSTRMATLEAIERAKGVPIDGTAITVPASDLKDGMTEPDYVSFAT